MLQPIQSSHWDDEKGNPAGGMTCGRGFAISWQNGPLGRGDDKQEPNGAFVEDIISAAAGRLAHYQNGKFACNANKEALGHLHSALAALQYRTWDRERRQVEGTHEV